MSAAGVPLDQVRVGVQAGGGDRGTHIRPEPARPGGPRGAYQEADRNGVGADTPPLQGGAAPFGTRRVPKGPLSTRSIKALSPFLRRADLDGRLPVQYSVFVGCGLWCGGGGFGARLGR